METVKVNRESVFFRKLLSAIAYSELIEHDNKIYRVFEKANAINYFDSLFPELEEEKAPTSQLEVVETQTIEDKTFIKVRTESDETYWMDHSLACGEE